ncbi:unnamed protein product [Ascophyllum nodosum]
MVLVSVLVDYLKKLWRALEQEDGAQLEACLSKDLNAIPMGETMIYTDFSHADIDAVCPTGEGRRGSAPPAVRSIGNHMLHYLLYTYLLKKDKKKAFQHYRGAYRVFVESNAFLASRTERFAWLLRTLVSMSRGVKTLADETDIDDQKAQDDVTSLFKTAVSACIRDRTQDPAESKRQMAVYMAVILFKHCFKINSLNPCKDIMWVLRSGRGDVEKLACRADIVAFLYFEGLILMRSAINDPAQRAEAERKLTRALKECHRAARGNRRRILANLIPLRMQMGCLPKRALLIKYDLLIFDYFCDAIRRGDLGLFSLLMKQHEHALDMVGIRLHLEDCRLLVYRRALRKISKATELSHILPLQDIKLGFYFSGHEFDGDAQEHRKSLEGNLSQDDEQEQEIYRDDQMKGILARLVAKGVINGVIRTAPETFLQLSQKNPFPPLPGTSKHQQHTSRAVAFAMN